MMPDSPHTSAPMVIHGRALALKNTCRNASSTSVEKHLSWSPDIHPTARWVPSTPHRARPAGHPPTRHPGAVDGKERECNVGHYVEADDKEETRPIAAVPPSVRGAITSTHTRRRPSTTSCMLPTNRHHIIAAMQVLGADVGWWWWWRVRCEIAPVHQPPRM